MRNSLKRLLSSPVFITSFAFAIRMFLLYLGWRYAKASATENLPFGYETGQVARSIAAGHGFASPLRMVDTGPTVWFTPLYPLFLAGIFRIWGIYTDMSHMVTETFNCAFAALTVIPIYSIAKRTFGKAIAVSSSWTWVFLPTALFFPITWVWDTAMTGLFLALIFWATLEMRQPRTWLQWSGYGLLWGMGVSINPSILSLLPFLLGWLIWRARVESTPWFKPAVITVAAFALCLVPWTVRNYRVFGKVIVLRSNFGLELWLGNNPNVSDTWTPWMHPNDDRAEAEKYKSMGEIAYMEEKQREALDFMTSHPVETAKVMFHRFVNNWLAVTDSPADTWSTSPLYVKAFLILNCVLSLSCMLGVLYAYRAGLVDAAPYALVILIFPLVFYVTHSSLRYRFPMDPIMVVLATSGVAQVAALARLRKRTEPRTEAVPSTPAA